MTTTMEKLDRLCKWRTLFAGWQLGTRSDTDPEAAAIRDHREVTILLRAEMSALTMLLVTKGVITIEEWNDAVGREANQLNADYERRFPGVRACDSGLIFDTQKVSEWMRERNWKP